MSDDKDLNELLDSALKDFDNQTEANKGDKKTSADKNKTKENEVGDAAAGAVADDSDDFFIEQAKVLADRMNTLFGGPNTPTGDIAPLPQDPEQILAGFHKMAEAAAMTLEGSNPSTDEEVAKYSDSIAQALKGLNEGADNLAAPISESDIASMFNSINLETNDSESNTFLPFMEGMMQSLLSAEILLPSIKELLEKYPKYLTENGTKLSAEDKERYEKQFELYKIIEGHLESENSDDTPAKKREKFKVVLDDMRRLQEYGQPPEEILNETAGDLPPIFDPSSLASGQNPQCPMM